MRNSAAIQTRRSLPAFSEHGKINHQRPDPVLDRREQRNPPVKSFVLRKRGALRGIRLISFDSLMEHLQNLT
jgi:hypothetical protein